MNGEKLVDDSGTALTAQVRAVGFFAICLAYFAIILDGSVLNVAVPAIRDGLHTSMAGAQWVLNGYTLTLAALLLSAGTLGDRFGLRRTLLAGIAVFTVASAACAAAPHVGVLVAARVAQGVGAAALLPATLALVPHLFEDQSKRARAAVVWVATGAISVAVGPLLGGVLIDGFGWRAIFVINLPIGVLSFVLARANLPTTGRHRPPLDQAGQLSVAASLGLLTGGLICAGSRGWAAPLTLGLLIGGVAAGVLFWLVERRSRHPMLPLEFFADRTRSVAVASASFMGFLFYGTLFVGSLYFQQLRGWSPGRSGVALLPLTVGSTIGPLVLYRPLAQRFGHRMMLVAGFVCALGGTAVLAGTGSRGTYPMVAAGLLLTGTASTIAFSALTSLLMSSVGRERSGLGSGVQNTARQAGALVSVSVLGSILNTPDITGRLPAAFAVLAVVNGLAVATGLAGLVKRPG